MTIEGTMALHEAIATAADPATVMDRVLAEALALIPGAEGAAIELCTPGDTLIYAAGAGSLAGTCGTEVAIAGSLSGLAMTSGAIQHCSDTTRDPRVDQATCGALGIASMLCVPLQRGGARIGVLKVASGGTSAFCPADEASLAGLRPFVSTVIGAAVELASVTAELLSDETDDECRVPDTWGSLKGASEAAHARSRFVANVVRPGTVHDAALEERIETVLCGEGLTIALQPIVLLADGSIAEVEALARFASPPLQGPDRWFADAARVGRGTDLELVAVALALDTLEKIPHPIRLAINVGPETFCSQGLLDLLDAAVPERIIVELTEHVDIGDHPRLRQAREDLRRLGCQVAIDDTGSGFAGLSLLLEVAPEIIKLDRALTMGIDRDPVRRALAGALVAFAQETGAHVVAEGIETPEELSTLSDLGISYGQGFYLARPARIEALLPLLDRRRLAISA